MLLLVKVSCDAFVFRLKSIIRSILPNIWRIVHLIIESTSRLALYSLPIVYQDRVIPIRLSSVLLPHFSKCRSSHLTQQR
jgi:ABC-type polysaccharide/polyol phosphate export permease